MSEQIMSMRDRGEILQQFCVSPSAAVVLPEEHLSPLKCIHIPFGDGGGSGIADRLRSFLLSPFIFPRETRENEPAIDLSPERARERERERESRKQPHPPPPPLSQN